MPTDQATPAATVAMGCAPVEFPSDLGNAHLDQGEDFTGQYSSDPPSSGPHDPVATDTGTFYDEPQRVEELIHALEHGAVVFWVNGLTSEQDVAARAAVTDIFSQGYESLIWTPYPEMDTPFAMTAWGVLQTCTDIDPAAMQSFVDSYYGSGGEGILACLGAAADLPGCTEDAPTPEPSASADFPDAAEAALLEFVPEDFRDTCVRPFGQAVGAVADLDCFPEDAGADQASYMQFPTTDAMDESYEETREFLDVASSQGQCSDPDQWPAEGPYSIGGEPAGRMLCTVTLESSAIIWWTDTELNIKSLAINSDGDEAALYEFWTTSSGPVRP